VVHLVCGVLEDDEASGEEGVPNLRVSALSLSQLLFIARKPFLRVFGENLALHLNLTLLFL
jgi:hypothetical protein